MIYEGAITDRLKDIIREELYDTGALYESLQVFSYEVPGAVYFDIQCEDYIVYHIQRLNLVQRLSQFPTLKEAYEKYLDINIEDSLQSSLGVLEAPNLDIGFIFPRCFVSLNGV